MKFPIVIESGDKNTAYGVIVPDLPGCFSAGDTLEEAIDNTKEAISLWIETELDEGHSIPAVSSAECVVNNPEYKHNLFAIVDVDLAQLSDKVTRINITLPARALRRLDFLTKKQGQTRSGYLTNLIYSAN